MGSICRLNTHLWLHAAQWRFSPHPFSESFPSHYCAVSVHLPDISSDVVGMMHARSFFWKNLKKKWAAMANAESWNPHFLERLIKTFLRVWAGATASASHSRQRGLRAFGRTFCLDLLSFTHILELWIFILRQIKKWKRVQTELLNRPARLTGTATHPGLCSHFWPGSKSIQPSGAGGDQHITSPHFWRISEKPLLFSLLCLC